MVEALPTHSPIVPTEGWRTTPVVVWFALGFALFAGFGLRLWLHTVPLGQSSSDEAISGLMARHLARGEWTTFYWGQSYGGTLETVVLGTFIKLTGWDVFGFNALPILESALVVLLVYRVTQFRLGRQQAALAGALVWVFPAAYVLLSTRAMLFYQPTMILGLMAIWFAEILVRRSTDHLAVWFVLGLVLGLGWWCSFQILFFAIPVVVWLVASRRDRWVGWGAALAGAIVGAAPWLIYYVKYDGLPLKQLATGRGSYTDHLNAIVTRGLPMIVGARQPHTERWLPAGYGVIVPLVAICAVAAVLVLCGRNGVLRSPLVMVLVVFVPVHALAPSAYFVGSGRYFIFLAPTVAFLLVGATRRSMVLAAWVIVGLGLTLVTIWDIRESAVAPDSMTPVVTFLEEHGIHNVYAHYWVAYKMTWESGEKIIAASDFDRYPPWNAQVRAAPFVAYVMYLPFSQDSARYVALTEGLVQQSIGFSTHEIGRYVIVIPAANVTPEQLGMVG